MIDAITGEPMKEGVFTVQCPECKHVWPLKASDVQIQACDSGGIYGCFITCPKCQLTQDLLTDD